MDFHQQYCSTLRKQTNPPLASVAKYYVSTHQNWVTTTSVIGQRIAIDAEMWAGYLMERGHTQLEYFYISCIKSTRLPGRPVN